MGGAFFVDWLKRSQSLQSLGRTEEDLIDVAVQSNVLLSIAHNVRYGRDLFWWGYTYYGHRLEPLIRRIAVDKTTAEQLGILVGSSPAEFRKQFLEKYVEEAREGEYFRYGGHIRASEDVLKLLINEGK